MANVNHSSVKFCFEKKQRNGVVAGKQVGLNRGSVRRELLGAPLYADGIGEVAR